MRQQILQAALGALLCACGGSTPPPASRPSELILPEESAGAEADSPAQGAAAATPVGGPATLKVVTKLGSTPVAARVKVFGDGVSVEGKSGEPLAVRAGDLEIEATLSDSKVLHGSETVHRSVTLEPGVEKTETVIFERSLARVEVRIHGKLDSSAVVTLSKDGATVAKLKSGDKDYVSIAPGRYNASVKSQRAEITSSDITLNEGATQTIPLDVK
jgi:hypothetical protein